jgi:hypothetical protein
MRKLQCKTTFNSAFVGKKNHQNRTRVDFGIMFLKHVVLYEILFHLFFLNLFWIIRVYVGSVNGQKVTKLLGQKVTIYIFTIFHIKSQFFKALFQSQFLFDFDDIFTNRNENVRSFL